jgi:diguanylate cyclase (GGDEF)-like protein
MENVHILTQRLTTRGDYLPFNAEQYINHEPQFAHRLVEKLQTTLDIEELLNIYSEHAERITKLSGLQFHTALGAFELQGSDKQYTPFSFELDLNGEYLGKLVYFCQYQLSAAIKQKLQSIHQVLIYPLRNALMYQRVLQLATKDSLTGLYNRSQFNDSLAQRIENGRRHQRKFSLMLLDLDNFKQVNDNFGHKAGDEVLIEFSNILKASIRTTESVYRFVGDEFAILIDDPEFVTNKLIAERIMHSVGHCKLMSKYGVTTSIGFTLAEGADCEENIFARADKGLYKAKAAGRNCARAI